ncbi:dynamin-related protein 4C-like, partial [Malus sylvestris]|uniref:dynamin-related protein 4C-like n=1 Tax=Malus sylvestris TaxID=3752 RepID=UPI0021AD13EB
IKCPNSIAKTLPDIVKKINDRLNFCIMELNKMPKSLSSVAEAMTAFMQIIGLAKESLRKILLRGEFEEYAEDNRMHCTARLVEMLNQYSDELHRCPESDAKSNFLMEEIKILEENKGISLPNFLPRNAFHIILQRKVNGISSIPIAFVEQVWIYIEEAVISVLMRNSENYYQLQLSARRAGHNLMAKMKEGSIKWMLELVEMEKLTDYTCDADYVSEWNKLMASQNQFIHGVLTDENKPSIIEGIGEIEVGVLRKYPHVLAQAYDLKMRMTAYWKVVLRRFVDFMALHLQLSVNNLVNKEMEAEIVNELMGPYGGGIERMLEESPAVAVKREKLNKSIKKLRDSKEVVAKIMDSIITYGD